MGVESTLILALPHHNHHWAAVVGRRGAIGNGVSNLNWDL